ncbi:alpha/beta fold hydrolase [Egibacter rhizosphaerae]|uniref:Alpha/beta fold hydrolase n=1 Tax=Egibacter rhizosphaerae TaxID=1670831 RepID=A0A411YLJ9_9ACTN|nr:alpha/beta fold hydrolase [Egibacter rhizosphaerae]
MVRVVVVVLAIALVVIGLAAGFQRRLIYLPMPADVPPADERLPEAEEVVLTTEDGLDLGAWYLAPDEPRAAVLVANGNAGHRGLRAPLAERLAAEDLAVLLFDYRGYGGNEGSPTEEGLARDVRAAHDHLVHERGHDPGRVVAFGESLGTGVVTELATEREVGALVLRSPFTDLAAVGRQHYPFLPVRTLLRDRYPVAERVARLDVPVAVAYGTDDGIVPAELSREVAGEARNLVGHRPIEGADHNDAVLLDGDEVIAAVRDAVDALDG